MSRNLVELVRRTHAVHAPTAIEVLKEAVEDHGEITDEDRRAAAAASGLPEAAVYGVSTFYDDLVLPRGARHVRVCTGTACFAATGLPEAAVYGVSTFYDDLTQPRGARHIRACTGTA